MTSPKQSGCENWKRACQTVERRENYEKLSTQAVGKKVINQMGYPSLNAWVIIR